MRRVRRLGQGLIRRGKASPQGPGATFRNSGQAVCNLAFARKLCGGKSCYRTGSRGGLLPQAQMLYLNYGCLPGQPSSPRQEEATAAVTHLHREGPAKRLFRSVRRPVLRHCGRLDWEVHSGAVSIPCHRCVELFNERVRTHPQPFLIYDKIIT